MKATSRDSFVEYLEQENERLFKEVGELTKKLAKLEYLQEYNSGAVSKTYNPIRQGKIIFHDFTRAPVCQ